MGMRANHKACLPVAPVAHRHLFAGGLGMHIDNCRLHHAAQRMRLQNRLQRAERVIERPPTAELRPDQKDSDSLPPYEVLDPILEAYVEHSRSIPEIVAMGFEEATVRRVAGLVRRSEYKRRQAPPGPKVTPRAFGRERRYPITAVYGDL